jgi:hypothetical protein
MHPLVHHDSSGRRSLITEPLTNSHRRRLVLHGIRGRSDNDLHKGGGPGTLALFTNEGRSLFRRTDSRTMDLDSSSPERTWSARVRLTGHQKEPFILGHLSSELASGVCRRCAEMLASENLTTSRPLGINRLLDECIGRLCARRKIEFANLKRKLEVDHSQLTRQMNRLRLFDVHGTDNDLRCNRCGVSSGSSER